MSTKVHKITPGYTNLQTGTPRYKNVQKVQKCTKCTKMYKMYKNVQKVHKCTKSTQMYAKVKKVQKGTILLIFPTVYYMLTTLLLYEGLQSSSKIGKFHFIIRTVERSRETESCTLESWIFTRLLSKTTVFMLESKLGTEENVEFWPRNGEKSIEKYKIGFWSENCYHIFEGVQKVMRGFERFSKVLKGSQRFRKVPKSCKRFQIV